MPLVKCTMAELIEIYPHIFTKSPATNEEFLQWFVNNPDFVQLSISLFRPQQCKSFSKVTLSAKAHNIKLQSNMCECLTPFNFFAHAFYTLSEGHYTDDLNEALEKLRKYIKEEKKHVTCLLKMCKEEKVSEKEICHVYAHHVFEPLLPHAELFVDKFIEGDVSECPFCQEKKHEIKPGATTFGVKDMWHGRPDLIIKHGKVQQAVTVKQGTSDDSGEPAVKKARMNAGDTNKDCFIRTGFVEDNKEINWSVTGEQDQEPIPQLLSQTIVNAFLVTKLNLHLKNFFIPSFLATKNGVMIVMYNVVHDALAAEAECMDLLSDEQAINKRVIFMIWLSLNFDKFCLDKSVEIIKSFLKPCSFRRKLAKFGIEQNYDENVEEILDEKPEALIGKSCCRCFNISANNQSEKVLTA